MPPCSSTSARCVNTLAGATDYSPAPSEDREALQQLLAQHDAEARLLPLVGDAGFPTAGQCYAFEGLQALKGAGAALALRRAAEMDPQQSELSTHFNLYELARTLPVAALLRQHDAGDDAITALTEDAELHTAGELARYCWEGDDGGSGTDDSCSFQGADETVRALKLECGNAIPLATLRAVVQSALELLALTQRVAPRGPTSNAPVEVADAAVGDEDQQEEEVEDEDEVGGDGTPHTSDMACGPD